jgi:hypothetical protein
MRVKRKALREEVPPKSGKRRGYQSKSKGRGIFKMLFENKKISAADS